MATRITGSTKLIDVLVALGRRSAEKLGGKAELADLAPGVVQATERLVAAREARKAAADARWLKRGAMEEADQAVTDAIRVAQHQALVGCKGIKGDAAYRALFPDDLKGLVTGTIAQREVALGALARKMEADPNNAPMAKALADALVARKAAIEACTQAAGNERTAVEALATEARTFRKVYCMARHQAIVRLDDTAAARPFFPNVAPKDHAVAEPEPPGVGTPQAVPQDQHAA